MRRRALGLGLATATALLIAVAPATAQNVQLVPFGGQTFSSPHYVTGAPGDPSRVFVVEGAGRIRLIKDGVTQGTPFLDIIGVVCSSADGCGGESGLFSIAFAPNYATSGRFYVFYTRDSTVTGEQHYLRIEEFRRSPANPDVANLASRRIVLEIPHFDSNIHNGGQLQFGPDGLLYISVGDGGPGGNGQNTGTLLGKLLRINPAGSMPGQYSIPADNPFAGATPGADQIYSYGLRNPWRFSFDRLSGDLTIGDVGQAAWEEIDFVPSGTGRGANFGWNCFEGSHPYAGCTPLPANHTPPVLEYPNPASGPGAVTGGYVIRDGALPSLLGRYLYADTYAVFGGELRTAQLAAGGSKKDSGLGVFATNVVSFGEDACAHIYVAAIGGTVYRLQPTKRGFPCKPPPTTTATPPSVTTGSASSVSTNSATLNGTVNPNGKATSYHFEYGTTTSYGQPTANQSAGSGTSDQSVSANISGLNPGTTYHFRLVATNADGTTLGSDRTFTTSGSSCSPRTSTYSDTILATAGVASYWRLGESSGTLACDSKGSNSGTYEGNVSLAQSGAISGDPDTSVGFDGATGTDVAAQLPAGMGAASASVETWAYMPASTAKGPFVKVGGGADGYGVGVGNGTFGTAGSHLVVLYEWVRWIDTGATLSPGWHHVALVIDASGHPTVYLDGSQVYSDASSGPRPPTSGVHIGGYTSADAFNRYFNGRTDEVALYSQALSATTIQQHYNAG